MDTKRARTLVRTVLIGVGMVGVIALVVLGARQVTALILAPERQPVSAETSPETPESTTTTTTATTVTTSSDPTSPPADPEDGVPTDDVDDPSLMSGSPTIIPTDPTPIPDVVTIESGVVVNLDAFVSQTQQGDGTGATDSGGADTSIVEAPHVVDPVTAPLPQPFGVGVWTEPENTHNALITVGVNSGPNGLSELTLDFGDGNKLDLDDAELDDLADGGSVEVIHRYEPTLTPQPQTVTATARDGSGEVVESVAGFTTRAEFLVGFSPLTVTALGDCDFFGKGDFELLWNNDGRERSSTFKLGEGDSYAEDEFRVGVDGVFFDEPLSLSITIREKDSTAALILKFFTDFPHEFSGPPGQTLIDVLGLGTHVIPYSVVDDEGDCDVRLDFAASFAVSEREGV